MNTNPIIEFGGILPISFGSHLLQGHERSHTIPILERLAIIEGYKDNYYTIADRPLTIFCDNIPTVAKENSSGGTIITNLEALLSKSGAKLKYLLNVIKPKTISGWN